MWNLPEECTEVSVLILIVWTLISGVFNMWRSAVTDSILNFWDNELRTVYTKNALWVLNSGIYIINKFIWKLRYLYTSRPSDPDAEY